MDYFKIVITAASSFLVLYLMAKLVGHKQISQFDFFDYISGITIGSIAAEMATELENPLKPLIAVVVYGLITAALGIISSKFPKSRKILNGEPLILFNNDRLYRENFKKAKLDLSEFLMLCRGEGYFDLSQIKTVIFECNGKISVLPKAANRPLTPDDMQKNPPEDEIFKTIIADGVVSDKNLKSLGTDKQWLNNQLNAKNLKADEVFLALCDKNLNICFYEM